MRIMQQRRPKKPFTVTRMRTVDFIDIDASLKGHVSISQQTKDCQPLKF